MPLWLSSKVLRALELEIARSPETAPVATVGLPKIESAFRNSGADVSELDNAEPRSIGVVIAQGVLGRADWQECLRRWNDLLKPGGRVILLDKGSPEELSRRLLCAGLTDIEQSMVGRRLLSCARACH